MLHLVFFVSGISGLIYQVVWVREFGLTFGNTIHSASLVVGIFMLGLGAGSYLIGRWADRRYEQDPASVLRAYAWIELAIAGLGLGISLLLPRLGTLVAAVSSYTPDANGWFVLTAGSYVARALIAALTLAPVTLLMGGTLTLLIRYLVRANIATSGRTVALLYGVNTLGAAVGAFLTDFALAPSLGLLATQLVAVALNVLAGAGAWWLSRAAAPSHSRTVAPAHPRTAHPRTLASAHPRTLSLTSIALALSGFAVLGIEILWLRHMQLLLGGFRAVFSLLLAVMLIGLGAGALLGGWLDRRTSRPSVVLAIVQALFVGATLAGIGLGDGAVLAAAPGAPPGFAGDLWFNLRPMLLEILIPAFIAGLAFPLANALVQQAEASVGRRAGTLYLANTAGAVAGSLVTGYWLLPQLGIQASALVLTAIAALAIVPLLLQAPARLPAFVSAGAALAALAIWLVLPQDHVLQRALVPQQAGERTVAVSEGSTELIQVVEIPGRGRGLITNGHAMASTAPLDQRYMRALAHIPLLAMESPGRVLVIGFGVGNSTHAATLHPSVQRVEVADLSRHILEQAQYFSDANDGVLSSAKVSVFVNDGRQHLQMATTQDYDLITLEPPPIAHAGVGALYSREFYELARRRLRTGGYIGQWLPAYQVPVETTLAMVRAFVEVFPQAVVLSGAQAELMLIGTTGPRIEIDPDRLAGAMLARTAVRRDMERVDLGSPREVIGTFVGSAATLQRAVADSPAVTDDRPLQEYGVRSRLGAMALGIPGALFDLGTISAWCPRCFPSGEVAPAVYGFDLYLGLMEEAYAANTGDVAAAARARGAGTVLGSAYLARVLPETSAVKGIVSLAKSREGAALMEAGDLPSALTVMREAVALTPDSAEAHNDLGVALASLGSVAEAREHFRRAVELAPEFTEARQNLARAGG